jgi:hypothetical protein
MASGSVFAEEEVKQMTLQQRKNHILSILRACLFDGGDETLCKSQLEPFKGTPKDLVELTLRAFFLDEYVPAIEEKEKESDESSKDSVFLINRSAKLMHILSFVERLFHPAMYLTMLRVAFECESLPVCEIIFDAFAKKMRFEKGSFFGPDTEKTSVFLKLQVLRMCNKFLRRLSKTTHDKFMGTILLFLTHVFDLDHKSGRFTHLPIPIRDFRLMLSDPFHAY